MKEEAKIRTLHPEGKNGVNISLAKYEQIREFVLSTISEQKEITFSELTKRAKEALSSQFEGNIPWYVVSVKLDLEARNVIERVPKTSPHRLRMCDK